MKTRLLLVAPITATVGVLLLGGLVGVRPFLDQAGRIQNEVTELEAENGAGRARVRALEERSTELEVLRDRQDSLRQRVPDAAQATRFLNEVTAAARAAGVRLTAATLKTPTPLESETAPKLPGGVSGEGLASLEVTLTIDGTEPAMRLFARRLDEGPRAFALTAIGGSATAEGEPESWAVSGLIWVLRRDGG